MKPVIYTGTEPTIHPHAGLLKPGVNEVHDDELADRLVESGRLTGAFLPVDGTPASVGGIIPPLPGGHKVLMGGDGPEAAVLPARAYYAASGDVHHLFADCTVGNNVERKNRRWGTGEKPLCQECASRGVTPAEEKE